MPGLKEQPIGVKLNIKFKDLYEMWSNTHFNIITKNTEYCYTAAYAQCEKLKHKTFVDLKAQDLQAVIEECPLGLRTKQNIKAMLGCMYKYAIENDYCNKNYAAFIKLPPKEKSKKDAFSMEEIKGLWQDYEAGHEFTGYILIMIYTGMRYGEASTVLTENIHLPERYLIGGIKTDAGINRVIPICEKVYPVISKLALAGNEKILDLPEKVFYNLFYETLRRINARELEPHCCRHTCATALAEAGVQPAIIKAILGHKDYATTMQYTHIRVEELLKAVNSI